MKYIIQYLFLSSNSFLKFFKKINAGEADVKSVFGYHKCVIRYTNAESRNLFTESQTLT